MERFACPEDARATNVRLTRIGWERPATAPGHVANVRQHIIDVLTPEQVAQLAAIGDANLGRVDPDVKPTVNLQSQRPGDSEHPRPRA